MLTLYEGGRSNLLGHMLSKAFIKDDWLQETSHPNLSHCTKVVKYKYVFDIPVSNFSLIFHTAVDSGLILA